MSALLFSQLDAALLVRASVDRLRLYAWHGGPWIHVFDATGKRLAQLTIWEAGAEPRDRRAAAEAFVDALIDRDAAATAKGA